MKTIYEDQKASVQTDVESNMFEIKKGTKQGDPLSSLLFNAVLQNSLKEVTQRWQKEKRHGNLPERPRSRLPHRPEVRRRRAFVRNLQGSASKMLCGFEESTEKSGTQDPRRKDENSQQPEQPLSGLEKRSANRRKREILRPVDYIPATGNDRNQESYQDSLGDVSQIQAGADIEKLLAQTPSPTVSTQQ